MFNLLPSGLRTSHHILLASTHPLSNLSVVNSVPKCEGSIRCSLTAYNNVTLLMLSRIQSPFPALSLCLALLSALKSSTGVPIGDTCSDNLFSVVIRRDRAVRKTPCKTFS